MKRLLRTAWIIICIFITVFYILSCLTPYISPATFSFISLFALSFPYLFIATLFCWLTFFFIQKRAAWVMLVVVILMGFTNLHNTIAIHSSKWQMAKVPQTLRIMTWNAEGFLNYFPQSDPDAEPRLEMYRAIKQYDPDVLCVQEFRDIRNDPHFISVKDELECAGYKFSYFSFDSVLYQYTPDTISIGVAIFSKTPLMDGGRINIVNKGVNENMIYADVSCNKKPLRIFTAHLLSFGLYIDTLKTPDVHDNIYEVTYKRKKKVQYKIRETELRHEKEVAIIRNAISKSPYPVIYCGDINSTPTSYTYNFLKGDLQDAFIKGGFGLGCTFYKLLPTLRIDVCLIDNKLQSLQCTVPQLYLSDHFPVVTDVTWKQ